MFFYEGIGLISLGLFSWSWACAGPPQASPVQSLHMKPLLHIYVIPQQQDPRSSSSSFSNRPPLPPVLPLLHCKINIKLHSRNVFGAHRRRVRAECGSGLLGALSALAPQPDPVACKSDFG